MRHEQADDAKKDKPQVRPQDITVTVFGAGISGLTAAHELVERGFRVQVIDPAINETVHARTIDRGIGGMARSQFACYPQDTPPVIATMYPLRSITDYLVDDVLVFDTSPSVTWSKQQTQILERLIAALERESELDCLVILPKPSGKQPSAQDRFDAIFKYVAQAAPGLEKRLTMTGVSRDGYPADGGSWATFEFSLVRFPGEHGFRFFPAFYRHLFDTMKRIRIMNPRQFEGGATCYDNLIPSDQQGLARAGKRKTFILPRGRLGSFEELRELLRSYVTDLGYGLADFQLFLLKMFKYMTSCSARRFAEYEDLSWTDFMEVERFSAEVRKQLNSGPQMMAGLRGADSDTRTQGNITVQLWLDQIRLPGETDKKLNGPTSSAWFDHWHDYLAAQGVTFHRNKLESFGYEDGEIIPKLERPHDLKVEGQYVVIALSLDAMVPLAKSFVKAAEGAGITLKPDNDFARIVGFVPDDLQGELSKAVPDGPLQHLSGIQYFFDSDVKFLAGHTAYQDAAWGLTSISQPQFWSNARSNELGYRGVLSVDIGIWNVPDKLGRVAWESDAETIAAGTWAQLEDHHDDDARFKFGPAARIPQPIAFALDRNLVFTSSASGRVQISDKTPFLVNRTSAYPARPGRVFDASPELKITPDTSKVKSLYRVHPHPEETRKTTPRWRYVLAGTYMQTYTRMTSMEAANESARHAVNALINVIGSNTERCGVWDPEDNELDDLAWLKEVDEKLFAQGRPHLVDILDLCELPGSLEGFRAAASAAKDGT
jgi:hypothetical protein